MARSLLDRYRERWQWQAFLDRPILKAVEENWRGVPQSENVLGLAGHLIGSMERWLGVLGHPSYQESLLNSWPHVEADELLVRYEAIWAAWHSFLYSINEEDLEKIVEFRGMDGAAKRSNLMGIIDHSLLHSQGHRAQLLVPLKPLLGTLHTDFIRQVISLDWHDHGQLWDPATVLTWC